MRRTILLAATATLVLVLVPAAGATSGTMAITSDTTLTEDHEGNIVVDADGVTLDCAGHTVTSTGAEQAIHVDAHSDVTIRNCLVTNPYGNGIAVTGYAERTLVVANTAYDSANAGIAADQAVDTRIIRNTASDNAGNGIQVIDATGVLLNGNSVSGNEDWGIATAEASDGVFRGNTANDNGMDGFGLGNSTGITLRSNDARGNGRYGFSLWRSQDCVVSGNTARRNSDGFGLSRSSQNVLTQNTSVENGMNGFLVFASDDNVLRSNVSNRNHQDHKAAEGAGFQSVRSDRNVYTGNVAFANDDGFVLWVNSNQNTFARNEACRNEDWDAYDNRTGVGNVWRNNHFCQDNLV
jgi:parallel beta-helix repeat protein